MQALLPAATLSGVDLDHSPEGIERRISRVMNLAEREMKIPHLFASELFSHGKLDELVNFLYAPLNII